MAIIGTLPNNIQNGQLEDATPLMADFNFIVSQVNANANPIGTLTAPSGTAMPFQQASSPLGWVAQTSAAYTDAVLRVITPATFANTLGAIGASGFLLGPYTVDLHTLTIGEMPTHTHTDSGHTHGVSDPGHAHTGGEFTGQNFIGGASGAFVRLNTNPANNTGISNTGIGIDSGVANIQNTGSSNGHAHAHTPNVKMVDHIIAVKS